METCLAPLRAWLRCTRRAEEKVSHALAGLSKASARNPWKCLALSFLGCLLCGLGFLRFNSISDATELWVDQHSQQMKNMNWADQYFDGFGRPNRLLITAKDGGNVLEIDKMTEILQIADDVRALVDESGKKFEDVCLDLGNGCFNSGVLRYFGTTAQFNSAVQSQADILEAVNKATFPDGQDAFASDSMGGIQRDINGSVISATAVRVDFVLYAEWEDMDTWEGALTLHFTKHDLTEQRYEKVNVYLQAERSRDDELNRTVQADIPLFALAFVLMSTFCACFLGKTASWTQSRRLLGVAEFLLVIFGCIAGYGTAMLVGVPFTVLHQILPFILVGIGIDDAFVICGAFDGTPKTLSYPKRIEVAVQRVGVSITLTTLTSLASFLLGATCVFPAVQWFCYYAASCCFFIWLLHLTAFPALLALDAHRAGLTPPRLDPCACFAARSSCMPGVLPVWDANGEEAAPEESKLGKGLCMMIRFLTSHVAGIVVTLLLFLAVAGIAAWQVSNGLGTDFDIMDLTPDQSFLRDFYNKEQEHFGGLSTGGLALPTNYYIRDVNFSTVEVQRSMEQVGAEMLALKSINSERGLKSWHTIFTLWANQYKGTSASLPLEAFVAVDVNRDGCAAGLPKGISSCATHFLTGPTFPNAVLEFLWTSMGAQFDGDIHWEGHDISVIRLRATHVDTVSSEEQVEGLEEAEKLTEKWQDALPGSFMSSGAYIFFDQYRIIVAQMTSSIGLCLGAVTVISALILGHPLSVLTVIIVLGLVFVDLMGNIVLWDLDLNSISMINLVMAVGLVVDYSMHMAHNFSLQDSMLPRKQRAELAVREMGQPIFLGVSTTFLAILPLAFSSSQAFRVFFKMFFGIVVAGGAHGLIFLPVLLSLLGPSMDGSSTEVVKTDNAEVLESNSEHSPKVAKGTS